MANLSKAPASISRLRSFRKLHRQIAILLFVFFIIIALTGLLLGWKKNSGELLMPDTHKGSTTSLKNWMSLDALHQIAITTIQQRVNPNISLDLDRIDARMQKGTVKFLFEEKNWEVQLDGQTGAVLSVKRRHADLIEKIHDGSIVDTWLSDKNGYFKLTYVSVMGLALLLLTLTGFWLWLGPKRLRKAKQTAE
ncbi:MAG: hypothetical protein RLY16_116 [Bacteroidota bacterium]|jgi:uncharacterized iron-regulated membrane protein